MSSCIVCKENKFSLLFRTKDRMFDIPGLFDVKKCQGCGLIFLDPQPSQIILEKHYPSQQYYSYKGSIEGLSGLIRQFRSYLIKNYYEPTILSRAFSLFVQSVPAIPKKPKKKPWKILDVGCGSGDTLVLLKKIGWEVYGLDIDENAIKLARENGLVNIKLGGYEKMANFPDNYFDSIRLYHVIEHIPDPCGCIHLIYKKLKPGGEVILGTPSADSVLSRIFGRFWVNIDIPRHLFVFSPKTISRIIKDEGFSHVSVVFCSGDGLGRSIIYTINEIFKIKLNSNNFTFLFFILYPLEWILDKLKMGDVIILRGTKS
ncbi:MAG: Methylase involved in ubiquinone/menaquinone biosynthesis [Candidatus Azambacteria bacterium GW2011_GWB1_42_17]|uniref:Methylase involved in ubiquinone/menaquinone biosynthesis n=1 Tax=Candidatus Azambacteria bacterium GW2011_GWB1_42_17 TaxID=1618615 RepID=A0A0G1BEI0_9BACT|nr:MAG: Methylase involved in ubiquinone/menaquinone biosynthesis [Candidatus Azambacteria bacterium GW2011_GWB1_42_17]